jgi:hypothetical protein
LPEFADLAALPAPHGRQRAVIGFGMGELVLNCPATDLSPVELEVAFAMRLAGSEAVGSRGVAAEPFAQKRLHFGGPVGRMVATRNPRGPGGLLMPGAGLKVIAIDFIEASPPQADPLGGRARFEFAGTKQGQNVTDERTGTAMGQLELFNFSSRELSRTGDAVPQTPWDFPLCGLKRQGHAGLGVPSPTCRLQASSRRSGCVPAEPYPPMEHAKGISPRFGNKGGKAKVRFCSHVRFC